MEQKNLTKEEVLKLMEDFPIQLRRGLIAITLNSTTFDETSLTEERSLNENQYILSVGDLVKDLKPGDLVGLNLSALTKVRRLMNNSDETISEIDIKTFDINGTVVGIVDERVIEYIYK